MGQLMVRLEPSIIPHLLSEARLQKAYYQMERLVKGRIAELTLANEGLRQEVAECQRMLGAWRQLAAQYVAIIESFKGLICVCSPEYEVEFMNQRLIERTGYYALGQKCYKVLFDREEKCPWCANKRVFRGETVCWEVLNPKDNRWYYVVNTPVLYPGGKIDNLAMIQDITDRKGQGKTFNITL